MLFGLRGVVFYAGAIHLQQSAGVTTYKQFCSNPCTSASEFKPVAFRGVVESLKRRMWRYDPILVAISYSQYFLVKSD